MGNGKRLYVKASTLKDVAAHAGVSVITASRALRMPDVVSERARERVARAVAELGYVPNPAARTLASARSNLIGVVIPSVSNLVFADVLSGMLDAADATRFELQFTTSRYSGEREARLVRVFATQRPAGMIVTGHDQTPEARAILAAMDCPVVQIMEVAADPVDMTIGIDQAAAGAAIVDHLVQRGYRRIAFLGGRMDPRSQRRLAGYRRAIEARDLFDPRRILTTPEPTSVALGGRMLSDLLAAVPDTDAVFCNNGDLALGALFQAQRRGIRVPAQLGIAGFNDLDMEAAAYPSITSVRTHRYEMGRRAVSMLVQALEGKRPEPGVVDLGFEIVARESTARESTAREPSAAASGGGLVA